MQPADVDELLNGKSGGWTILVSWNVFMKIAEALLNRSESLVFRDLGSIAADNDMKVFKKAFMRWPSKNRSTWSVSLPAA